MKWSVGQPTSLKTSGTRKTTKCAVDKQKENLLVSNKYNECFVLQSFYGINSEVKTIEQYLSMEFVNNIII